MKQIWLEGIIRDSSGKEIDRFKKMPLEKAIYIFVKKYDQNMVKNPEIEKKFKKLDKKIVKEMKA